MPAAVFQEFEGVRIKAGNLREVASGTSRSTPKPEGGILDSGSARGTRERVSSSLKPRRSQPAISGSCNLSDHSKSVEHQGANMPPAANGPKSSLPRPESGSVTWRTHNEEGGRFGANPTKISGIPRRRWRDRNRPDDVRRAASSPIRELALGQKSAEPVRSRPSCAV